MGEAGYKKLMVWQKADELAYQVYMATKTFPKEELYAMTSQLRRAALSVPTNIVEGYARQGKNEFRQFANIALGSLAETKYLLGFCLRLRQCQTITERFRAFVRYKICGHRHSQDEVRIVGSCPG